VLLLSAEDERLDEMIRVMHVVEDGDLPIELENDSDYVLHYRQYDDADDARPTFADILDAGTGSLPDLDGFLRLWRERFSDATGERGQSLYLEAVYLTDGVDGLATAARDWGGARPRGYLTWIDYLARSADWKTVVSASREALTEIHNDNLVMSEFGLSAARYLGRAGEQLHDHSIILESARYAFSISPSNGTLIKLVHVSGAEKADVLVEAIQLLSARERSQNLLVRTLLMAGRIEETLEIAMECNPVGWSHGDNPGGLCFSAILAYHVLDRLKDFHEINSLLTTYADVDEFECEESGVDKNTCQSLMIEEIQRGIEASVLGRKKHAQYLRWAHDIGTQRIDHIVSNTHRRAYRSAAKVLVALHELHKHDDDYEIAGDLLDLYRTRYNRHTAFKRELNAILSKR
jgi:hypothetical protein